MQCSLGERRQTPTKTRYVFSVPSLIPRETTKQLHRRECIVDTSVFVPRIQQVFHLENPAVRFASIAEYRSNLNKPQSLSLSPGRSVCSSNFSLVRGWLRKRGLPRTVCSLYQARIHTTNPRLRSYCCYRNVLLWYRTCGALKISYKCRQKLQ